MGHDSPEAPRISAVEYRDQSAHARLDAMERSLTSLAESVANFADKTERHLSALGEKISATQSTDHKALLALGGLILSAIVVAGTLVARDTESQSLILSERDQSAAAQRLDMERRLQSHMEMPGHYEAMQRHARINAQLEEITRRLDDHQAEQKEADRERIDIRDSMHALTQDRFSLRDYLEWEGLDRRGGAP